MGIFTFLVLSVLCFVLVLVLSVLCFAKPTFDTQIVVDMEKVSTPRQRRELGLPEHLIEQQKAAWRKWLSTYALDVANKVMTNAQKDVQ